MACRICDSTRIDLALDLGLQPWCNNFLTKAQIGREPVYPLRLVYCRDCGATQLDYTVPKEVMFSDHTYLSGVTATLSRHFQLVAHKVDETFFRNVPDKSVLDIGSNDGTQLKHFQALNYDVLGVESSKRVAQIAVRAGVPTINGFFNDDLAREMGRRFHVINAAGVFFHLEELHSVTEGIRRALREDGVFVVQFLYMKSIVDNLAFDQIYHEHLLYYNLQTIEWLLRRHGLALFDAYLSPIHGGSIVGFVTHAGRRESSSRLGALKQAEHAQQSNEFSTYVDFGRRIDRMKVANLAFLDSAKKRGKRIFGFGAPAKGNTLLNYFGIGTDHLDVLVEKNSLRRGLYSPGMHIPIALESELTTLPDIYYVLAWNFKDEILTNNQELLKRGIEFYFPVTPKES
jgi:SAM-dependent methyltransferase